MSQVESDFYIGVDVGQLQDYTALAVLAVPVWIPPASSFDGRLLWPSDERMRGWVSPRELPPRQLQYWRQHNENYGRPPKPPLNIIHLQRFELGTRYPVVVESVRRLIMDSPLNLGARRLLVDATGVGRGVVDLFEQAQTYPTAITITGGTTVNPDEDGRGYKVPQRELISVLSVMSETGRLKIAESLPEAATLVKELLGFQRRINPHTANDSYAAWREGTHDDLLFAVAMACWFREWWNKHHDEANARQQSVPA
jgi:hypothetical protein